MIRGRNRLYGSVRIESAKNAVLPMMAASVLTKEKVVIENCPKISDVLSLIEILGRLGVKTEFYNENLIVDSGEITGDKIPEYLMKELRSSIFVVGALLSRTGSAEFSLPGGCNLGERPIDFHINGLKTLGYSVADDGEIIKVSGKATGSTVKLPFASVGATENIILASVTAKGATEIINAAREPEIVDLIGMLNSMGAKISGAGTGRLSIEGVERLYGTRYKPMSDRIETGTYLIAAVMTGGKVRITNADTENISFITDKFCNNTCKVDRINGIITINSDGKVRPFDFSTGPFPAFPTDMQPQSVAMLSLAGGISRVKETVFKNRFGYVESLNKMGAAIKVEGDTATCYGVRRLHGETVWAGDLRGGAGICLAALAAEGDSHVYGVEHIDRGYYAFEGKLKSLGADIERIY